MKLKIHKEKIPTIEHFKLYLPSQATVLHVAGQRKGNVEDGYIWFSFNPDSADELVERHFLLMVTGAEDTITAKHEYIGTYHIYGGNFVGHIYEEFPNERH